MDAGLATTPPIIFTSFEDSISAFIDGGSYTMPRSEVHSNSQQLSQLETHHHDPIPPLKPLPPVELAKPSNNPILPTSLLCHPILPSYSPASPCSNNTTLLDSSTTSSSHHENLENNQSDTDALNNSPSSLPSHLDVSHQENYELLSKSLTEPFLTSKDNPISSTNIKGSVISSSPPIYGISASELADAIDHHYSSILPEVETLFPWLHGLHKPNWKQFDFFDLSRKYGKFGNIEYGSECRDLASFSSVPSTVRSLLVVKIGLRNSEGTLIGTSYPDEILCKKDEEESVDFSFDDYPLDFEEEPFETACSTNEPLNPSYFLPQFIDPDPPDGISLRNFQIQVAKWATISDIVLYVSDESERENLFEFAHLISLAQLAYRKDHPHIPKYLTCIVQDEIHHIAENIPHIIAIPLNEVNFDPNRLCHKTWDFNLSFHESLEMSIMSSASVIGEISIHGGAVWLGNSANMQGHTQLVSDYLDADNLDSPEFKQMQDVLMSRNWTLYVSCAPDNEFPSISVLDQYIRDSLAGDLSLKERHSDHTIQRQIWSSNLIHFPASGVISLDQHAEEKIYAIVSMCKLLYVQSHAIHQNCGAGALIFCKDGYSKTSLIALAYLIYSTGLNTSQALIDLHCKYHRPFYSHSIDREVLMSLEPILLKYSPAIPGSMYDENYGAIYSKGDVDILKSGNLWSQSEEWLKTNDCFPSRIFPHMYLGSLLQAENPVMLTKIGIKRVISVGEPLSWVKYDTNDENEELIGTGSSTLHVYEDQYPEISKVMFIDNVEDDGIDPLTACLGKCLDFLDEGYRLGEPTLVHCRVGVSRSATVCIAEVMKRLGVGLPRAYLYVRVRRLNLIIQPHLRFMFELVKWEEKQRRNGKGWLREVDWPILCREIAIMNQPFMPS